MSMNKLPKELLLNIIQATLGSLTASTYHRNLISLSLVARAWYRLIDTTPSLWAVICPGDTERVIERALTKSQRKPLKIGGLVPSLMPQAILRECTRWSSVHLGWNDSSDYLGSIPSENMQLLRHFSLGYSPGAFPYLFTTVVPQAPLLESLDFYGLVLKWKTPLSACLMRLSLHDVVTAIDLMITMLRSCTSLVKLHLEECQEDHTAGTRASYVPVTLRLPLLQECNLIMLRAVIMAKLLDTIVAPACKIVQSFVHPTLRSSGGAAKSPHWPFHNLFQAFPLALTGVSMLEMQWAGNYSTCDVLYGDGTPGTLSLGVAKAPTGLPELASWISEVTEEPEVTIRFVEPVNHKRPIYTDISSQVPRMSKIVVQYDDDLKRKEFDEALASGLFPNLRTLKLNCDDAEILYRVLLARSTIHPPLSPLEQLVLASNDGALEESEAYQRIQGLVEQVEIDDAGPGRKK